MSVENITIKMPERAFVYMMRNTKSRDNFSRRQCLYCLYYRKKDGSLGTAVVDIPTLSNIASQCVFPSYNDRRDFELFIASLYGVPVEGKRNWIWRTTI